MKKVLLIFVSFFFLSTTLPTESIDYKVIRVILSETVTGGKNGDIEKIILTTLNKTKNDLSFNLYSDSNKVEITKTANCVGYTKYFNKYLISKLKESRRGYVTVSHVRAKVLIFGNDVHFIKSRSLKDHDISVIHDKINNKTYFVDPSLSEVLGNIVIKR
jgi:hypothetical protein